MSSPLRSAPTHTSLLNAAAPPPLQRFNVYPELALACMYDAHRRLARMFSLDFAQDCYKSTCLVFSLGEHHTRRVRSSLNTHCHRSQTAGRHFVPNMLWPRRSRVLLRAGTSYACARGDMYFLLYASHVCKRPLSRSPFNPPCFFPPSLQFPLLPPSRQYLTCRPPPWLRFWA